MHRSQRRSSAVGWLPHAMVACLLAAAPSHVRAEWTQPALRDFARRALADRTVTVVPPQIVYGSQDVRYDFGEVYYDADFGEWNFPFRHQITVEMIRKYRSSPKQRQNWEPYLARVEEVIRQELSLLGRYEQQRAVWRARRGPQPNVESLRNSLSEHDLNVQRVLASHIEQVAAAAGQIARHMHDYSPLPAPPPPPPPDPAPEVKAPTTPPKAAIPDISVRVPFTDPLQPDSPPGGSRFDFGIEPPTPEQSQMAPGAAAIAQSSAQSGWLVRLITNPSGASVYYLPEFEYQFKQRAGLTRDWQNWRQALGATISLSGNYRFFVRWSNSGRTMLTSKVSIAREQTLVLYP